LPEMAGLDEGTPLFVQVAERLAAEIADGGLAEGERVPSTNELAAYYRINPATAAKGINVLASEGLLEKHRGIGMFVAAGARTTLLEQRREQFAERYVAPLLTEATRLGIGTSELVTLIREIGDADGASTPAVREATPGDRGASHAGRETGHVREGINA
jgi:GntR family transcriptional regulator